MEQVPVSIFQHYYTHEPFSDRFEHDSAHAVDVLIPVMHTNELWPRNLVSIYREIPVNRLLIGDGGCIDGSVETARTFPRVEVFDHSHYVSLGYSIRKLIEAVETEWFVYLHSDVYLPAGWYDTIQTQQSQHDWIESRQRYTFLVEHPLDYTTVRRPYSGSQLGRTAAFAQILSVIDDDYLYRNEDIILARLIEQAGFSYGVADSAFHYHQVMHRPSRWTRKITSFSIQVEPDHEEEIRAATMQARGLIKYLAPEPLPRSSVFASIKRLQELGVWQQDEFMQWVADTNPVWLPTIQAWQAEQQQRQHERTRQRLAAWRRQRLRGLLRSLWPFGSTHRAPPAMKEQE